MALLLPAIGVIGPTGSMLRCSCRLVHSPYSSEQKSVLTRS